MRKGLSYHKLWYPQCMLWRKKESRSEIKLVSLIDEALRGVTFTPL